MGPGWNNFTYQRGTSGDAFGASMVVVENTLVVGVPNAWARKRRVDLYAVGKVVLFDLVRNRIVREVASPRVEPTQRFGGSLIAMGDRFGVRDKDTLWIYDAKGRKKLSISNPDGPECQWMDVAWTPGKLLTGSGNMMQAAMGPVRVQDDRTGAELVRLGDPDPGDCYFGLCLQANGGIGRVGSWCQMPRDGLVYEFGLSDGLLLGEINGPDLVGYCEFGWPIVANEGVIAIGGSRIVEDDGLGSYLMNVVHVYRE